MGIFAAVAIGNNGKICPWGSGLALTRHKKTRSVISCVALLTGKFRRKFRSKSVCALQRKRSGVKSGLDREGLRS